LEAGEGGRVVVALGTAGPGDVPRRADDFFPLRLEDSVIPLSASPQLATPKVTSRSL
jgi:hypothetical protein